METKNETKDILLNLRKKAGLSQDELAERLFVTRQAVSRWEKGDTIPNIETLKLLSKLFDVSINTLLGSPRKLICQCCGMPLADSTISREKDGFLNEDYCKWCYADGAYLYSDMEELIEVCVKNMASDAYPEEEVRAYLRQTLPQLEYWKRYETLGGNQALEEWKDKLLGEINGLNVEGLPKVTKLYPLVGKDVNLEYRLPNGQLVRFLDENATYFGNQLECVFGGERRFGVVAGMDFILVCTYEGAGEKAELVVYRKR